MTWSLLAMCLCTSCVAVCHGKVWRQPLSARNMSALVRRRCRHLLRSCARTFPVSHLLACKLLSSQATHLNAFNLPVYYYYYYYYYFWFLFCRIRDACGNDWVSRVNMSGWDGSIICRDCWSFTVQLATLVRLALVRVCLPLHLAVTRTDWSGYESQRDRPIHFRGTLGSHQGREDTCLNSLHYTHPLCV